MRYSSLVAVVLAGVATAVTPTGFEPSSSQSLIVAFGNTLAVNGTSMTKAETASPPIVGTAQRMTGTFAIMMVDPDIPPATAGGSTSELLHWMQSGFTSANTSTTIGGQTFFEMVNLQNTSAIAAYLGPSPPDEAPNTHRYTQLLLQLNSTTALTSLMTSGKTRTNFSAVNVLKSAGLTPLAGNSFNVTNSTNSGAAAASGVGAAAASGSKTAAAINSATLVASNITKTTSKPAGAASPSTTGTAGTAANGTTGTGAANAGAAAGAAAASDSSTTTTAGTPKATGSADRVKGGAFIAGLGAFAAAVIML